VIRRVSHGAEASRELALVSTQSRGEFSKQRVRTRWSDIASKLVLIQSERNRVGVYGRRFVIRYIRQYIGATGATGAKDVKRLAQLTSKWNVVNIFDHLSFHKGMPDEARS
jgi:hypothetical protein